MTEPKHHGRPLHRREGPSGHRQLRRAVAQPGGFLRHRQLAVGGRHGPLRR